MKEPHLSAELAVCLPLLGAMLWLGQLHRPPLVVVEHRAPAILQESSATKITVPTFGYYQQPQCDDLGDAFFNVSQGFRVVRIFELTQDPDQSVLYKLPPDLAKSVTFEAFSASRSGGLHVLGEAREGSNDSQVRQYLFAFSDDGSMRDKIRLDLPLHLLVQTFASLQNGDSLVAGTFGRGAVKPLGTRYVALLNPSGQLIKTIDIAGKEAGGQLAGTAAVEGEGGYVYLARDGEVIVLSPAGDVERIPFTNPYPGSVPDGIQVSQGLLSITLVKADKRGRIEPRYLVLNAVTGDVQGYYAPSQELGDATMMCFSRPADYSFLRWTKTGLEIVAAAPR